MYMKYIFLVFVAALAACTGTLTENQKKRIKESMEEGKIQKVTESQVTETAFALGRQVASAVMKQDKLMTDAAVIDSIAKANNVEIISLQSDNKQMRNVERQLLEAYQSGGTSADNIQKMGPDSLLYTKPVMREHPDGSTEFLKAIGIRLTRKQVVLSIKQ